MSDGGGEGAAKGAVLLRPLLVAAAILAVGVATQLGAYLNHDVAFLAWVARAVAGGAVYGRDILEVNFPLAFLIYLPAVPLGAVIGLSLAVKLWTAALAALSLLLLAKALPAERRGPVLIAFALFVGFALPREFGQREQFAFILVAPWCVEASRGRWHSILVGALAGLGFAIKPHFLIPLAVLALYRRRLGREEAAIVGVGALYALLLLVAFRPFLVEALPLARAAYGGIEYNGEGAVRAAIAGFFILALAVPVFGSRDRTAMAFLLAAAGFYAAAVLQMKLFPYHFLPGWGFAVLAAAALLHSRPPAGRALLAAAAAVLVIQALPWWRGSEGRERQIPRLVNVLDRGRSFTVIAVHPYPSFPTALHTRACFLGWSNSHWFLPFVAKALAGEAPRGDGVAEQWAVRQAVAELRRSPDTVVVDTDWSRHTGLKSRSFDALAWLRRDPEFDRLWQGYSEGAQVGPFRLFRLRAAASPARPGCSPAG